LGLRSSSLDLKSLRRFLQFSLANSDAPCDAYDVQ